MKPQELKEARLAKSWGQSKAAARLGMSQAYLNMLENGKRQLTPDLTRKFVLGYGLSPETLPVPKEFTPAVADGQYLAGALAKLGYPGFAFLRSHTPKKNPAEVLLVALAQERLDGRVAEALPWVALEYWQGDSTWLVEQARKVNLQNRLGFVVSLARQVSERAGADPAGFAVRGEDSQNVRTRALRTLEDTLSKSRLAREDAFYRPPRTASEKEWLSQNRTADARNWNLLTDLRPEHLQYAR